MEGYQKRLRGKVVLITGASGGLGEQIAYKAAAHGATVVVAARRLERLKAVRERCAQLSGQPAYAYSLDVNDVEQIDTVVDRVVEAQGGIDILVNNAGFGLFQPALEMDPQIIEEMFRVNVLGAIRLSQVVASHMIEKRQGQIINIASQAGKMATPKSAVYAATKFAVLGYSNALRLELQPHGIQVTTVNTGPVRTGFFQDADPSGEYLDKLGRMVLDPGYVATKVVNAMFTSAREINLPWIMEIGARLYVLFPRLGDYFACTIFARK